MTWYILQRIQSRQISCAKFMLKVHEKDRTIASIEHL